MNIDEVPVGEGRSTVCAGEEVAVFRLRDGSVRAVAAVCPHGGGPLADGMLDDRVVICPLHGYTYDLVTGEETTFGGDSVRVYQASVGAGGDIALA